MTYLWLAFAVLSAPPAHPRKLHPPTYISQTTRELISKRMDHHAEAAISLAMGVILLEHDEVGAMAEKLASQPGFARPRAGETDTLSSALPDMFFTLQDQLRTHARELGKVAALHDNRKLHAAYSKLTATCMTCHAVYLYGPGSEESWWPGDKPASKLP